MHIDYTPTPATDSLNNCLVQPQVMVGLRLSRRARRFLKKIQRAPGKYELQEAASTIQAELDKRLISYDEALTLGNIIQHRADQFVDERLALVGDAAHSIHPIAGQGLNAGFKDIAVLAQVIEDAFLRGEDFGSLFKYC